jgi:hypothetical protein
MSTNNAAANKITIIPEQGSPVTAQYNPKEVGIDKSVPWQKAKNSHANTPDLEFTSADGRSLSFELFFDGYEENLDVHATYVSKLLKMAEVMDENGDESKKRPPQVKVTWGTLPEFKGVVESVSTKYTMFNAAGMPVRCTCSVKFKEANRLSFKKEGG